MRQIIPPAIKRTGLAPRLVQKKLNPIYEWYHVLNIKNTKVYMLFSL